MPALSTYLASTPNLFSPYLRDHRGYMTPQDGVPEDVNYQDVNLGPGDHLTPAQRHAGLQALINYCGAQGFNLVIPASTSTYQIDGNLSLRLAPSIHITLDGIIENTRTSSAVGLLDQAVFKIGNHHPENWPADGSVLPWHVAGNISAGARSFTMVTGSNTLTEGGLVIIRGASYYIDAAGREIPLYMLCARVIDITGDVITIDRPFDEAVTGALAANPDDNTVLDAEGEPAFVADRVSITGSGGVKSQKNPWMRTSMFECNIDIGSSYGRSVFFGNLFSFSRFRVSRIVAFERMADIAGCSHFSTFEFDTADYDGVGSANLTFIAMNESARACTLKGGRLTAMELSAAGAGVASFITSRRCIIDIDEVVAPNLTNGAFAFSNPVPAGGTTPLLHDNELVISSFRGGTALPRFVSANNAGGENKRNKMNGSFFGTPTSEAALVGGDWNQISSTSWFENGVLELAGGAGFVPTNLIADEFSFPDGVSGSTVGQRIRAFP